MLEDRLEDHWSPCKWQTQSGKEVKGRIINGDRGDDKAKEPIHFLGPSPFDDSAIADEEEKKEQPETSQPDQHALTDHDDPNGAAQQKPNEETNRPEPPQTV